MRIRCLAATLMLVATIIGEAGAESMPDPARDILVTFDNKDARVANGGLSASYRNRKRYSIGRSVRRLADAVVTEYDLIEIDRWPIRSLAVYCFVYRVADNVDRSSVVARLRADSRVESAQPLQRFDTSMNEVDGYDDTYANLQYGLDVLDISAAHRSTLGSGVRIAIVDSDADRNHEDLKGRIRRVEVFSSGTSIADHEHGTAVASIIGARSNNALGIVGIAPEAKLDVYVACWSNGDDRPAVCDSFTLLKALDTIIENPPNVLNLSLKGPHDPLLERVLLQVLDAGVVVVAAGSLEQEPRSEFPASMDRVIGVVSSIEAMPDDRNLERMLFAPGERILVAVPNDTYDFRSGSSLAAAHVSGVVALLLSRVPKHSASSLRDILRRSQRNERTSLRSINACAALNLAGFPEQCSEQATVSAKTENE